MRPQACPSGITVAKRSASFSGFSFFHQQPPKKDENRQDESAVEHETALVDANDPLGMCRELNVPVFDHIRTSRPDHTRDHHRQNEIPEVLASAQLLDERPAEHKPHGHARAVGLQMEKAEINEVGKHGYCGNLPSLTSLT